MPALCAPESAAHQPSTPRSSYWGQGSCACCDFEIPTHTRWSSSPHNISHDVFHEWRLSAAQRMVHWTNQKRAFVNRKSYQHFFFINPAVQGGNEISLLLYFMWALMTKRCRCNGCWRWSCKEEVRCYGSFISFLLHHRDGQRVENAVCVGSDCKRGTRGSGKNCASLEYCYSSFHAKLIANFNIVLHYWLIEFGEREHLEPHCISASLARWR